MHPTIGPLASRRTHDSTRRTPTPDLPHTRYADTRGLAAARAINGAVAAGAPDVAATLAAHARTIEAPDHALTIALARVDVLAGRPDDALRRLDAVGGARRVLVAAAAWAGGRRDDALMAIRGHAADIEAPIRWWLADALLSLADETTDRCLLTMHLVRLSLDDPPLEAMATELLALLPDTRALLDDPMPRVAPDPTDDAGRILRLADRLVLAERFLPLLVAGACRRMDPGAARLAAAIGSALTRFRDPGAAAMALLRLDLRLGHADAARDWATCIMRWWPEAIGLTPGLEEAPRPQARLAA